VNMSKAPSEFSAVKAYSQGYMSGIYGHDKAECPSKQSILKAKWIEGRNKGIEVRKMHSEKMRQKSWFSFDQT
jgi:ribosome modulation factor